MRRALLGLGLIAGLAIAVWLIRDRVALPRPDAPAPAAASRAHGAGSTGTEAGLDAGGEVVAQRPKLTDDARRQLVAEIAAARARRLEQARPGPDPARATEQREVAPLALANKTGSQTDWEKRQLEILNQLLAECHDMAAGEEPGLSGTLGVRFRITGEPVVGGVVDGVEIMGDYSTIQQPTMRECVTESLYALELEPPPEGVSVDREVTLRFD